jgi:hypothetical protein
MKILAVTLALVAGAAGYLALRVMSSFGRDILARSEEDS